MAEEGKKAAEAAAPTPRLMPRLILASGSAARAALLRAAGVPFEAMLPAVDEAAVKEAMRAENAPPAHIAEVLAEFKALRVSMRVSEALVLGADQVLVCNGVLFDKPADLDHARAHLQALRGRRHELVTVACLARNGAPVWRHVARAHLTMRPFSDDFLDQYLDRVGAAALESVGAYHIEGLGSQLFSAIDGDWFAILGLPLLPLLDMLRQHGVLAT